MANLEEKVKAFLSDEKKVEAIAGDQKFIDAVSGGTATTETIAEEFGKAGLALSESEAEEVRDTARRLLDTPLEKLSEIDTKNVSGGIDVPSLMRGIGHAGEAAGAVGGLGCWIAGTVCKSRATKALNDGNTEKSAKLTKAAKGLDVATKACVGVAVSGFALNEVMDAKWYLTP